MLLLLWPLFGWYCYPFATLATLATMIALAGLAARVAAAAAGATACDAAKDQQQEAVSEQAGDEHEASSMNPLGICCTLAGCA